MLIVETQKTKFFRDAKLNDKAKGVVFREKFHICLPKDQKVAAKKTQKLPPLKTQTTIKPQNAKSVSLSDQYEDIKSVSSTWTYLNSLNGPRPILKTSNNSNSSKKNLHHKSSPPNNLANKASKNLRFENLKGVLRSKSVNFCRINSSIRYFTRHIEVKVKKTYFLNHDLKQI
jgi:hypothetical protein